MAWTAPRTWVTGELVTAALMNTHIRDNLLETAPAKVTTAGDVVYATAANAIARLAIGATGSVMVGGGSAPSYTTTPTIAGLATLQTGLIIGSDGGAGDVKVSKTATRVITLDSGPTTGTAVGLTVGTGGGSNLLKVYGSLILGATPADAGLIRMNNDSGIFARNAGNTANVNLAYLNSGNAIIYGGTGATDAYIDNGASRETFFRFGGTASVIINDAGIIWNSALGDALGVKLTKTGTRTLVFDSGETGGTAVTINVGVSGASNTLTVYGTIYALAKLRAENDDATGTGIGAELVVDATSSAVFRGYNRTSSAYVSTAVNGADLQFRISNTAKWNINSSGHLLAATDNAVDIGASGATRPRNVYVAGTVVAPAITVPFCQVYNSGALTCTTGVGTTVLFDTEVFDNFAMHSTVTNTERITCVQAGVYTVSAGIQFAANATGDRLVEIYKVWSGGGSSAVIASLLIDPVQGGDPTTMNVTGQASLAVGDYLYVKVRQSSGGNLNVTAATSGNYDFQSLSALWVGTL